MEKNYVKNNMRRFTGYMVFSKGIIKLQENKGGSIKSYMKTEKRLQTSCEQ